MIPFDVNGIILLFFCFPDLLQDLPFFSAYSTSGARCRDNRRRRGYRPGACPGRKSDASLDVSIVIQGLVTEWRD